MKHFALRSGWPERWRYSTTRQDWELLKKIPGSFATEHIPHDCPVQDPITRAYFDLLPGLLAADQQGKYLAFGYGRDWYAVGHTVAEAFDILMIKYPHQMPILGGEINQERMNWLPAKEYWRWKTTENGNSHLTIPHCSM